MLIKSIFNKVKTSSNKVVLDKSLAELNVKQKAGDGLNKWFAKNRSLVLRQTPVWAQSLSIVVVSLGTVSILAGIFFRIDEVISVEGQLKSIGGTVEVKSPVGGKISDVFFKDGQLVEKGQLLIKFDTAQAAESAKTLKSLINLEKQQLLAQLKTIDSQLLTVNGRSSVISQRIETKKLALQELGALVNSGGFQRLQYLDQKDQLFELQTQLNELNEQKSRLELQASQIELSSSSSMQRMRNELNGALLQLRYQSVKAPVSGIIFDPRATPQGVLAPGERILSVVPQSGLYAEVYVPNTDIGFIKLNQQAKVRVSAFPFTRYGELEGKVSQIGADALEPTANKSYYSFPIKLALDSSFLLSRGISIPLKSGMSITANLKLRDKPVISLFSDMLVDQTDSIRSMRQQ